MNDPCDEIAAELARLRPVETSDRLNDRVQRALGVPSVGVVRPVRASWWFPWVPLSAAAALALVVAVSLVWRVAPQPQPRTELEVTALTGAAPRQVEGLASPPALRQVSQAHYLLGAEDNGLVFSSTTTPWRKVRWQYVSASEWRDEQDKTTFRVLIPREETTLIPVNIQ